MKENIRQKIQKVFELDGLRTGVHSRKLNKDEINVSFLWSASVTYFVPTITVAIIHANVGIQGFLLLPPMSEPLNREFGGPSPIKPINLINWRDPVEASLVALDLSPGGSPTWGDGSYSFDFMAESHTFNVNIVLNDGPIGKPSLDQLGKSILQTIYDVGRIYSHPEINIILNGLPPNSKA